MIIATAGLLDSQNDMRNQIERLPYIQYNPTMPMGQAISQQLRRLRIKLAACRT